MFCLGSILFGLRQLALCDFKLSFSLIELLFCCSTASHKITDSLVIICRKLSACLRLLDGFFCLLNVFRASPFLGERKLRTGSVQRRLRLPQLNIECTTVLFRDQATRIEASTFIYI